MSDYKEQIDALVTEVHDVAVALHQNNQLARKRNRLAKRQHRQSKLNYEQLERQYLIEKSRLQPIFTLSVTEFLTCEPDFVNDPEQASEVKFLFDRGIGIDQRILRIKVTVKGEAEYMQPSIVVPHINIINDDERAYAMSRLLYFVPLDRIAIDQASIQAYLVYRDKTTLPVALQYRFDQRLESTLPRWDVEHLNTVYADSNHNLVSLRNIAECRRLLLCD